MRKITLICGISALAACQADRPNPVVSASMSDANMALDAGLSVQAKAGYDLSEALCSGCHAIVSNQLSPNPESPGFEAIANTEGLTLVTLKDWLRDSHNYPEKMNFEVVDEDVDALAAYIITLRSNDYQPAI
ncbi:hypothetical protein GRI36_10910 [Altererythrobacter gangjinensis]|uniref:Cytochrome c domain-containing protein n=1 Tax=Pontixanthobacter gangjinensis TaxID=1028742 RepID=A0A6I4SP18_9SPHN|nr:hypothetical protein [Pontixanthobacter gangjinensis]